MIQPVKTQIIKADGKELRISSVHLEDKRSLALLPAAVKRVFEELAPFATRKLHRAHIEPFTRPTTTGFPGAWTANDHEFSITPWDERTRHRNILDVFAEELHHLIRYQNVGYPKTLGENIAAEAMARAYASKVSKATVPWTKGRVSQQIYDQVRVSWDDHEYDHSAWFYTGPLGKWVGYRVAHQLMKRFFDEAFDLKISLTVPAVNLKSFLP